LLKGTKWGERKKRKLTIKRAEENKPYRRSEPKKHQKGDLLSIISRGTGTGRVGQIKEGGGGGDFNVKCS